MFARLQFQYLKLYTNEAIEPISTEGAPNVNIITYIWVADQNDNDHSWLASHRYLCHLFQKLVFTNRMWIRCVFIRCVEDKRKQATHFWHTSKNNSFNFCMVYILQFCTEPDGRWQWWNNRGKFFGCGSNFVLWEKVQRHHHTLATSNNLLFPMSGI